MKKLSDNEKIERLVKIMTDYFNVNNKVKGDYADWDDNVIIYTFKFVPVEMVVNKNLGEFYTTDNCEFEGHIMLKVTDIQIANEEETDWEQMNYEDDLPEFVWEGELENIEDELYQYLPQICLRAKFVFNE
jgi:hypothetical protein